MNKSVKILQTLLFLLIGNMGGQMAFAQIAWNCTYSSNWYDSSKSEFTITTPHDFASFLMAVNSGNDFRNKTVTLKADIMFNDTTNWQNWASNPPTNKCFIPIGNTTTSIFRGTFDGKGYIVSGVYINSTDDYLGLFGYISSTTLIKNLGVKASYIKGNKTIGGLISANLGGTISECYYLGIVAGTSIVGGLAGINSGTINSSYSKGTVTGTSTAGGLVGYTNGGSINESYSTSTVTGSGDYVGGLVGHNSKTSISYSYSIGSVTGTSIVGGLAGYTNEGSISESYSTSTVTGSGNSIGGLVGTNDKTSINYSYSIGSVTGKSLSVGGLVGLNYGGEINSSYSTGAVSGTENYVGGLVGVNIGVINSSYSSGTVTGESAIGGFVGNNHGTISNSYATGAVRCGVGYSPNAYYCGGFAGDNHGGKIFNSYSTGKITGGTISLLANIGGFVGRNSDLPYGKFGEIIGVFTEIGQELGGLLGEAFGILIGGNGSINGSYYDTQTSNQSEGISIGNGGVSGKTTAQMKTKATFVNWDFNGTWGINATRNSGYPYLLWPYNERTSSYHIFAYQGKDAENMPTPYGNYIGTYVYNDATASNPKNEYYDGLNGFSDGVAKLWNVTLAEPSKYSGAGITIDNRTTGSPSIADCKEISYYYKGDPHWFLLEFPKDLCATPTLADDNKWGVAVTPAQSNWTKKTINLTTLKLARSWEGAGCGGATGNLNAVPIDLAKVTKVSWVFDDNVNNGLSKNLMIANVACLTPTGGAIADNAPPSDITVTSGWQSSTPILSNANSTGLIILSGVNNLQISSTKESKVQLFDIRGSLVFSTNIAAGNNILSFEKQNKGVYYAVIQSGSYKQTLKVVLK
ncbi:MAG: T9SS type A sorting domain-containing protein [Fibromonadales bacterium]|nr:T9SS type A sorting domain-containing protein [Fibromonadales bacterium]